MELAILHLIRSLDPARGGPVEYLKQLARAQKALGVHSAILTVDPIEPGWVPNPPVSVIECGPGKGIYGFHSGLERKVCEVAKLFRAVLVHGLWQYHGLCAARAA